MADEKYLANRLKYHAASRVATQTGEALVQALNVDGHTVTTNKIWTAPMSAFVNNADKDVTESIAATTELATIFKTTGAPVSSTFKGGTVWTNSAFPAVKLYENVQMTKVVGSDGGGKFQAFEILDEDGKRIVDWISPTAVADQTNGKPVAGYSGIPMFNGTPLKQHSSDWAEGDGRYEFIYIAGLLTFEPGFTPQEMGANGENLISITAFKYIGEYADQAEATQNNRLATIEEQLGIGGGEQEGSVTEQLVEVEKTISGYTSTSTISSAITAEATARTTTDNFLSGVLSGYDTVGAVSAAIKNLTDTAATYQLSAISTTEGYAFSYQLMKTANGVTTAVENSIINIPKDQFLTSASYDSTTESLNLTFATKTKDAAGAETETANTVSIPMSSMVHEYEGSNGIIVTDVTDGPSQIAIKINDTVNESGFLTLTADGLALTGVQAAINAASNDATAGLTTLSAAISGYLSGEAVKNKFDEVDGRLDTDETNISTLSSALAGYTGENAVSSAVKELSTAIDGIRTDTNVVSAFQYSTTASGTIGNNTLSIDVKVSETSGNAITVENDGLFVQKYKAGENIAFGEADASGVIPINGTFTFTLSAATDTTLGGIKSGSYIAVDESGSATVKKVENKLTVFGQEYDGSAAATVATGDHLSADAAGNVSVVTSGAVAENSTGLVNGGDVYAYVNDGLADLLTAISGFNDDVQNA